MTMIACLGFITFMLGISCMRRRPPPFVVIGSLLAALLFVQRTLRKDVYGTVEVASHGHLGVCRRRLFATNLGSDAIGFVGAVYVLVRGLTNITEIFQRRGTS